MAENSKQFIKYLSLLIAGILITGCANQLPPGGGEIDKIPPEIIEVYPSDGTTNYTGEYIELGFSEYVEKRSVKDAIFISPALETEPELNWSGKNVRIYFQEPLRENTTYVITIGTDVEDYNNKNNMAKAFTLTFSTGSKIDRRVVTGKVYDAKPAGILIYAYMLNSSSDVTDTLLNRKPDYVSQSGTDGSFKLGGLAAATYRIFAVQDQFRDLIFQAGQDRIGVPYSDITLSETDTLFSGMNFFLSDADTSAPRIISAVMTDRYHLLVTASEEIDSTQLVTDNFYLSDSTAGISQSLLYAYKGNSKPVEFVLVTRDSLPLQDIIYLFSKSLADKKGNIYNMDFSPVTTSDRPDTTAPSVAKSEPQANADFVDFFNSRFNFTFNDAFDTAFAKGGITFTDTSGTRVPFDISFNDNASFTITPSGNLTARKDYIISLDFKKFIDAAGNKLDSVYKYKFKTISGLDFTGVTGTLIGLPLSYNPVLVLQSFNDSRIVYTQKPDADGSFNFERVQAGKYNLWAFADTDSSGTYSNGWPFPFKPSEQFAFFPDTLNLRPRWAQTDMRFYFKQQLQPAELK